ncbi:phosphate-regulating neutral endopeptidase PHEX-like [Drosophila innubila]|uniref:phosphate-regulating neutral endopeptidase PHEX-like n=1 Tax=Drosophila innubila TaxID=198719 RepID=UPI00148E1563|nr:phosphate-regulating neutral endopeptidase PHEX-like [Drosophila innubila]
MKCRPEMQLLLGLSLGFAWTLAISDEQFNAQFVDQVLRNVNDSVEPCVDFYSYACGNWSENYKDTENYLDMPGYMDYKYNTQLLGALQMQHQQGGIYDMLWSYYVSCRDLNEPALNELLHLLEPQLQLEWPIFKSNHSEIWRNETEFDWLATLAKLRSYGLNGVFIKQDVNVRRENGSHYVIMLMPQIADATPLIEQNILDLYVAFGVDEQLARNLTAKLMQLEWQVANLTHQMELQPMSNLIECTLPELQQHLPQINWSHYLTNLLEQPPDALQLLQVSTLNESYVQQLQQIFKQTSNETICYYLMFKLLYALIDELPMGVKETRSIPCLMQLRGHMPLAMHFLYETHYYSERREVTDAALQRLQQKLSLQFERLLQQNHLQLSAEEQAYVLEELRSLRLKIGNLPPRLTMQQLLEYYKDLQLHDNDFYGNKLQLLQFYQRREQQLLANKPTWDYYQQDAFVARSSSPVKIFQNAVLLPHGYLQLPLYDARLSQLLQHAQLGFILAHELQHAFDLFHIVYDARGNYNTTGLAVLQHFANFSSCYTSVHNAQQLLLSESMSDIVGLRLAFASYFDHVESVDKHSLLQQQQLFFINSVQFLCANMQQIRADSITEDVEHGMHNERVNRNWPQHEHFAKAFNCTVGQAMYQPHSCRLW